MVYEGEATLPLVGVPFIWPIYNKTKRESIATPFSARGNKMNYEELYKKITEINFKELAYGKRNVLNDTKKILPDIQSFMKNLMNQKWDDDIKEYVMRDIMDILEDIVSAYENDDQVLLMDATAYGVQKYLKLFVEDKDLM